MDNVLNQDLISRLVKATNDREPEKNEGVLYGTIVDDGIRKYVRLDGSTESTPVSSTTDISADDRVLVQLKNHTATVTGNVTDPAVGKKRADGLESSITQTAAEIRLEVANEVEGLNSSITQTASDIRSEVSSEVSGLNGKISNLDSKITQTAEAIRSEVSAEVKGLDTKISSNDSSVREYVKGLADTLDGKISNNSSAITNLDSKITQTAGEIRSEVSAEVSGLNVKIGNNTTSISNLDSKITQTAGEIRSEVSAEVSGLNKTITDKDTAMKTYVDGEVSDLDKSIGQNSSDIITLRSSISQNASSIETLVTNQTEFSKFQQTVEGFSFMGTGGSVKIKGGDIQLTGCITWADLDDDLTVDMEQVSADAASAADSASKASSSASDAASSASSASSSADSASSSASSASTSASNAASSASSASSSASSASSSAITAANEATRAKTQADKALSNANSTADALAATREIASDIEGNLPSYLEGTTINDVCLMSPVIIGGIIRAVDNDGSFTQMDGDGLRIYVDEADLPKAEIYTYRNSVYLVLGSGDNAGRNRFVIEKTSTAVSLIYEDGNGEEGGLIFRDGGTVEVIGTFVQ